MKWSSRVHESYGLRNPLPGGSDPVMTLVMKISAGVRSHADMTKDGPSLIAWDMTLGH